MIVLKKIVIIGAGASGVYLSILLKKHLKEQVEVIVLEQNASPLKKLLATGNGRCNLSNKDMSVKYYQSDNNRLVDSIISSFDMSYEMEELGLYCLYQGSLLYPKSEQALSVKNILMETAINEGVLFFYEQDVYKIECHKNYHIYTRSQVYKSDYVIFAMGSEAGKLSGVGNERYQMLKSLHLNVIEPRASLVQLCTKPIIKSCKGVRVKGTFKLLEDGKCKHVEKGEMLFTDYGVSGIAIMQISSYIEENHQYELSIDMFDHMDYEKMYDYIEQRHKRVYNHFYDGLVNNKLSAYLEKLPQKTIKDQVNLLKDLRLKVTGLKDYTTAQVMKGGLSLHEVDLDLQLKKYSHMYAIGEILNVAGMCGGYNLHFAFASAKHVYKAIEREFYVKD